MDAVLKRLSAVISPSKDMENNATGMTCSPLRSRPPMVGGAATPEEASTTDPACSAV